mmetsp:Transcript_76327/g.196534  ORF Transcript_76327/g.196534 Transcript_76327/m.196534 type:complete len:222 (-) Transcript_76327:721-1386(-)
MLASRLCSISALCAFSASRSAAAFASASLRCSREACFRDAASCCCLLNCLRSDSMWSSMSMLRWCSFFMLFCVRSSSLVSQASIFSCFWRSCDARCVARSRRYACFADSASSFSCAISSIRFWRYARYSRSACLRRALRSAIFWSRFCSTFFSSSLCTAISAWAALSSSIFRSRASSSFFLIASFFCCEVSMISLICDRSRVLRSAARAAMRSSRFLSFSA